MHPRLNKLMTFFFPPHSCFSVRNPPCVPLSFRGFYVTFILKTSKDSFYEKILFLFILLFWGKKINKKYIKKRKNTKHFALDPVTKLVEKRTEKMNLCLKLLYKTYNDCFCISKLILFSEIFWDLVSKLVFLYVTEDYCFDYITSLMATCWWSPSKLKVLGIHCRAMSCGHLQLEGHLQNGDHGCLEYPWLLILYLLTWL